MEGRTEGRTEPRTDVNQYTPPLFQSGGSILNGCGEFFNEKSGEKEKRTNIGKNK